MNAPAGDLAREPRPTAAGGSSVRDLKVVSFGVGMTVALVAKHFAEMGAQVSRIAPVGGDPSEKRYPAYDFWLRRVPLADTGDADQLIAGADVVIVGGEDFPGVPQGPDADALAEAHPRLIVLRIDGYPAGSAEAKRPAVDLLVQARTGVVCEQFSDRPIAAAFPMPSYGAALQGLVGAWVALVERERSGRGQRVAVSLAAGAAMFWAPFWMKAEKADPGFTGITPRDVRHLILRCRGDEYLQLTMGVPGAVAKIHKVLGIAGPCDPNDRGMPDHSRGPARFFGDVDLFQGYSAEWPRDALIAALRAAGIPTEPVLKPGESWDDAQTRENAIIETDDAGWSGVGNPLRLTTIDAGAPPLPARLADYDPARPPLAGVRVIDCGIFVAGPYASKLLADYGADVIRLEPPSGRSTLSGERTIIAANFGKRAICVDAKTEEGRMLTARLCADADIVLHNFRPGVSDRLGLDQRSLRALNPALITLETTAYGATGPKMAAPGFDMVMQATTGLEARAGGEGNPPLCSRSPLVDFATGAVGAVGLLAGLYERFRTGRTVSCETNLLNVGLHMMSELVRDDAGGLIGAPALNAAQTGVHPAQSLYRAADGWLAITVRSEAMGVALLEVLGLELSAPPRAWGEGERAVIAAAMARRGRTNLLADLDAAGVWAEPVVCDAWDAVPPDGQIVRTMDDAQYGHVVHCVGPLVDFSRSVTVPATRLATPPGADSREVLAELGVTAGEAETLFAEGVVR